MARTGDRQRGPASGDPGALRAHPVGRADAAAQRPASVVRLRLPAMRDMRAGLAVRRHGLPDGRPVVTWLDTWADPVPDSTTPEQRAVIAALCPAVHEKRPGGPWPELAARWDPVPDRPGLILLTEWCPVCGSIARRAVTRFSVERWQNAVDEGGPVDPVPAGLLEAFDAAQAAMVPTRAGGSA